MLKRFKRLADHAGREVAAAGGHRARAHRRAEQSERRRDRSRTRRSAIAGQPPDCECRFMAWTFTPAFANKASHVGPPPYRLQYRDDGSGRSTPRSARSRMARSRSWTAASSRVGKRVELRRRPRARSRAAGRRLGHARAGRLPHPSRLRRQPRRRVRAKAAGRELRGDRARRRRHRLDRAGDPRSLARIAGRRRRGRGSRR